tara:strand:+ start:1009 stop:1530 length:522 start_codon:yes stop_codon:yes gene_type:complete
MQDKIKFSFSDEEGNVKKYYIGYDYTKAGSCCGVQVLADIHIAGWRSYEDEGGTEEGGYYSTMPYRSLSKELKMEAFEILKEYIEGNGHRRTWNAGMVVLCDYVKLRGNNRNVFLTREFAEWDNWNTDGLVVKNPNSPNYVQLWSKYLYEVKVNPHYEVSEVNEVTNETLANA